MREFPVWMDTEWLRTPTKSLLSKLDPLIKKRFPIVDHPNLLAAFVKLNRKPVTFIECPEVSEVAFAVTFLVGAISDDLNESFFKTVLAQKRFTQYSIDMLKKLTDGRLTPVQLYSKDSLNDKDANLLVATFPKAFNFVEEELSMAASQLTHLVIEGFDGENALDLELLFLAIKLTRVNDKFRVIVITDGLVQHVKDRVVKLCDNDDSLCLVDLLVSETTRKKPERDVIIFDSTSHKITQVKENIYGNFDRSKLKEVDQELEKQLTYTQLKDHVNETVQLIKQFIDAEIELKGPKSSFTYVVFVASAKVMRMLSFEMGEITRKANVELFRISTNSSINYVKEKSDRVIVIVSDCAEDAFILDDIEIVIDMGLTTYRCRISSSGSNQVKTIWADRVRMIRRASHIKRGTVAYPFNYDRLKWMRSRVISKFPGHDIEMRYFHDSRFWSYRLNEERTNRLMKRAEDISIRTGLISYSDPRYCTPMGSFCSSILPMLSPRLAKLILCGIVCGCEDAAIALASILADDHAPIMIECSKKMRCLMELVKVDVKSEHLAILHAYDRREETRFLFGNSNTTHSIEKREGNIRMRIKKEHVQLKPGAFVKNEEIEKRLLLAIAMAFGDRMGFAVMGTENAHSRFFHVKDIDNGDEKIQFEASTRFPVDEEQAGIYYEMREKGPTLTAVVTMLPVTILGAIGNIGGWVEKSTMGLYLNTNTGGLHVKMDEEGHVNEMMDIRKEVAMEVQIVALSYLQSDRYMIQFKNKRGKWMDELIPLLNQISPIS